MHFTVLRSKLDLRQTTSASTSKLYGLTTHQWEIQNSMFRRQQTVFSRLLRVQNTIRVIEGKIIWK